MKSIAGQTQNLASDVYDQDINCTPGLVVSRKGLGTQPLSTPHKRVFTMPQTPPAAPEREMYLPFFVALCIVGFYSLTLLVFLPLFTKLQYGAVWIRNAEIICSVLSFLTLYCYYKAVYFDPQIRFEETEEGVRCSRCSAVRRERTHHCGQCRRCIDRYDHHCFWIDNCVGRANHKFFILFLLYIVSCMAQYWYFFYLYITTPKVDVAVIGDGGFYWQNTLVNVCLGLYSLFVVPLTPFATIFLLWSTFLTSQGMTSYDYATGEDHHYQSLLLNFQSVFGNNPLLWLVPVAPFAEGESGGKGKEKEKECTHTEEIL